MQEFSSFFTEYVVANFTAHETIDGMEIFTITANEGLHIGDTRYATLIVDDDLNTVVAIATPSVDETIKMASKSRICLRFVFKTNLHLFLNGKIICLKDWISVIWYLYS